MNVRLHRNRHGRRLLLALVAFGFTMGAAAQVHMNPGMLKLAVKAVVLDVVPGTVQQGQQLDLRLRGTNLRDGLHIDLGAGIQVGTTRKTDPRGGYSSVHVAVAADAAPGRRQVVLVDNGRRDPQRAWVSVEAAAASTALQGLPAMHIARAPAVSVTAVKPDALLPGHDYMLLITGQGLTPGTTFDFGAGVQALSGSVAVNDRSLGLKVHVDAKAPPGRRVVGFTLPEVQNGMTAGAATAVRGHGPATVTIKSVPIENPRLAPPPSAPTPPPASPEPTIAPPPSAPTTAPPPVTHVPSPSTAVLASVQPPRVRAGSQAQLVFSGQGLKPGLRVDYGDGIHLQPLRPLGGNRFAALARIDATVMPGRHMPRATQPGSAVTVQPPAALQVLPGATIAEPKTVVAPTNPDNLIAGLRVASLFPARLDPGKTYTVMADGLGFTTRMQLDLGRGITVDRVEVINDHSARVHLTVDPQVTPGMRFARARTDSRVPWQPQPARVLVQQVVRVVGLPKPQWHAPDWNQITVKGRIDLQTPKWYAGLASQPAHTDPITHKPLGTATIVKTGIDVPTLKDDVIFTWQEVNPGLADWYEVRFYRGDKLVVTRKVEKRRVSGAGKDALPTFLIPDAALVAELGKAAPASGQHPQSQAQRVHGAVADTHASKAVFGGGAGSDLPGSDLTWEVVGFHSYLSSGLQNDVAQRAQPPVMLAARDATGLAQATHQAMTANTHTAVPVVKEVEHSERWPLNSPRAPTGMACGSEAASTLNVIPIDNAASKGEGHSRDQSTAVHTGERWELIGHLDLERSPWASDPQMAQWPYAPGAGHGRKYVATSWHFDNLFIDWGDGTVEPLALTQPGNAGRYRDDSTIDLDKALGDKRQFRHAYAEVGTYTVRVYQLSEADLQAHSAAGVSLAANAGGTLYATALHIGGGAPDTGDKQAHGFEHGKAVADRAYMLMCKPVHIEPRTDDATNGPLHLVAAKLRGFPEDPGDSSPPAGVKVAPAPDNSPLKLAQQASGAPSGSGRASAQTVRGEVTSPRVATTAFARGMNGTPTFSACDVALTGGGYLYYYGSGEVRMSWYLDGAKVGSSMLTLAPSWPRTDKQLASKDHGDPLIRASDLLLSMPIPLKRLGDHALNFDAEVVYDASGLLHLGGLVGDALGSGNRRANAQLAAQLSAGLQGAPAIGVLPPQGVPMPPGGPGVVWLQAPLRQLAAVDAEPVWLAYADGQQGRPRFDPASVQTGAVSLNGILRAAGAASRQTPRKPPTWVGSNSLSYRVAGVREGQACIFHFPVKDGGSFTIAGLQDAATGKSNVTHQGNQWNGTGTLRLKLPTPDGTGSMVYPVPITFHDWQLQPDGATVAKGSFEVHDPVDSDLVMPATNVHLTNLAGTAGDSVKLGLLATLRNANIHLPGSSNGPPALRATGEISPEGDFYAQAQPMPDLGVYDSGFILHGLKAALDFSASQGRACAGGNAWRGVAFTAATLDAYTFDLTPKQAANVSGWGIDGAGFCGTQHFAGYDATYRRGSIHWDAIDARASGGTFTANYQGVRAHVPWLDVDLKADSAMALSAGKGTTGGGKITLNLKGDAPRRDFGAVSIDADGLALEPLPGVGLVASAQSTHFAFRADGQDFAKDVVVPGLYFGMDGKAYFNEKGGSTHVNLSGTKGMLSQGVIDLKGMDITATPQTTQRLQFDFAGSLSISHALPAADAPVSYRVDEPSPEKYIGSGPVTGSFVIHKPFPDAHASTDTVIRPTYVGSKDGSVADAAPARSLLDWLITPAMAATPQHMRYCGDVDLGMFGGPPVKGGFALGYQGSDDFWAAHASVGLGSTGVPLVPPFMSLYQVGGGLGYNVKIDSFGAEKSCAVTANIDNTPAFDAMLVVGDPTHFVYGFDGHFTVKVKGPEAGALMQYKAWIVRHDWSGDGDFHGHFQYMGGSFDGTLNGHYGFLDNKVYIEATHDAIAMHFGGGTWYIHAGTRDNPVKGHVLIVDAGAWLGVGSEGLYAGAKSHLVEPPKRCDGGTCAQATANALIEAKITPQPHISADGHMNVHAKACAIGICLGAGVGAGVHIAALPPELALSLHLGGCPPGHLDVGIRILPTPGVHVGGNLCAGVFGL